MFVLKTISVQCGKPLLCKSFAQGKTFGRRIYVYIDKMIDMISQSLEICNLYLVIFAFLALKSSRHH